MYGIKRGNNDLINKKLINNSITVSEVGEFSNTSINITGEELVNKNSEFQNIKIINNKWWGKILWLDNILNLSEKDEFIYHEMLVHIPMFTHNNPKNILIIGGGDGGSAREVLKHNIDKITLIDIDKDVIDECKKYLPNINNGAFNNDKLNLIIGDGIEFVKKSQNNTFDVIIVDSTDPSYPLDQSISNVLFTEDFYKIVLEF